MLKVPPDGCTPRFSDFETSITGILIIELKDETIHIRLAGRYIFAY